MNKCFYLMKGGILLFCALVMLSSCCTLFCKGKYPLMINSEPDGAAITITNNKGMEVFNGNTPTTVTLKSSSGFFKKAEYTVKITYPGYDDKTVMVSSKIKGSYFWNLLGGGLIGMLVVDPASGKMWKLDTKYINVPLVPTGQAYQQPTLQIMSIDQISNELKEHLIALED